MKPLALRPFALAFKPRAFRYALFVVAIAALCAAAPWRGFARQLQASSVVFVFEVNSSMGVDEAGTLVVVEARNELNDFEPPRSMNIKFNLMAGSFTPEGAASLDGSGEVNLNATRRVVVSPHYDENMPAHLVQARPARLFHWMTFSDVNWPGAEHAHISGTQNVAGVVVYTLSLPLPPSKYRITADVKGEADVGKAEPTVNVSKELLAGKRVVVPVKSRTSFETLLERFGNRESLLISVIVGLLALVAAVLKDKIKEGVNRVLDGLGKFSSGKLAERRFYRKYFGAVASRHKHLRLVGFSSTGISRPLLEEVFVSLRISGYDRPSLDGDGRPASGGSPPSIPFAAALVQYPKMVILGAPGAGKTTTLSYALLTFAQNRQRERFGIGRQLLPIFIPLRRLSAGAKSILEDLTDPETQILPKELLKDLPKKYFENRLSRGQCLVLLDGLDEVVDEKTYRDVADKINDLASAYPNNRFVVTCRIAGWKSYLSGEFAVLRTQDFSRNEIQKFVLGWHRAVITQSEHSRLYFDKPDRKEFERAWARHYEEKVKPAIEIKSRNLLSQIDSNNRILAIAVNPMLLSLTCLVHSVRNILPRGRTILYSQCIELLIDSWERSKDIAWHQADRTTPNQKEAVLREIAFDFQERGKSEDTRENIEALVAAISKRLGVTVPADELLEEIELRSGLLIERSIGVFGFSHLTLQEYLVAKHVLLNPKYLGLLHANIDKQEWREVLLLYAGLLDDATALVKTILERSEAGELAALTLAARCIGDSQHCDAEVTERVITRLLLQHPFAGGDSREEVVEALAALVVDFTGEPKSPREMLLVELIQVAQDSRIDTTPPPNTLLRSECIAVLGRAKATAALPTIVKLLFDWNPPIQEAAADALVSFGNLALEALDQALLRVLDLAGQANTEQEGADFYKALLLGSQDVPEHERYRLGTIEAYIGVLRRINTSGSAKLLLGLYASTNATVLLRVSVALARMLKNPFTEADLQQMRREWLPHSLSRRPIYGDGWPRPNLPPNSAFPQLEDAIINDLAEIISLRAEAGHVFARRDEWEDIPFKLMFPALLRYVRSAGFAGLEQPVVISDSFWVELGFDRRDADSGRLNRLATQIRNSYSPSLSKAVQSSSVAEADSADAPRRALVTGTVWLSNLYFTVFTLLSIIFICVVAWEVYLRGGRALNADGIYVVPSAVVSLLMYLSVVVYTQLKLRRRLLSPKTLGTLIFPLSNLLKVLRNSVTSKRWVKFIGALWLIQFMNPIYLSAYPIALLSDRSGGFFFTTFVIQAIAVLLCVPYLKLYLLASNPTLLLLLSHPEGAKLVGAPRT